MTKHICLFGGPGCGKSLISTELFSVMKKKNIQCEYLSEYAKSLVFSKDFFKIKDQLMILARQSHPWFVLEDQVDYTINDGPFLIGLAYLQATEHLNKDIFEDLIVSMYKSYNTINIFLERNTKHEFEQYGRNEDLESSVELDNTIKDILNKHNIPYVSIKSGKNTVKKILKLIQV